MRRIICVIGLFWAFACSTEELKLVNPNSPGLATLDSESGLKAYAMGIYEKAFGWEVDGWLLLALCYHSQMGDEAYTPWGNFFFRWTQQYTKIRLPNGQEYPHTFYPGVPQKDQLQSFNTLKSESGAFLMEWAGAYLSIGQANRLLAALNDPESTVVFAGDSAVKKNALRTWALWWKGFMYARVGSMYLSGVIVNELGKTNGHYLDHNEIIVESNRNFDQALSILATLNPSSDYVDILKSVVPDFNNNANVVTPDMWMRIINTYKARNVLVNKKVTEMTPADWASVEALANNGIQSSDNIFTLGMTPDGLNDLTNGFMHPYILSNDEFGWLYASERIIQEFKPGDARLARNFHLRTSPLVNQGNRGWIFGTRYGYVNIEDGGSFATAQGAGQLPVSPTYEENLLMLAEAKIHSGNINGGLNHIDEVRIFQGAGLAAVSGNGLSQAQALEELRRERRVALYLRGLAFYDARRLGITAPENQGGGRSGAMILLPSTIYDPELDGLPDVYPCFIDYNYMDYWDIPASEFDFNQPLAGSAIIKN